MRRTVSRSSLRVAVAAALALGALALPSSAADAADPARTTGTSPSGATYVATWSCVGGQVRFVARKDVAVQIDVRFREDFDGQAPGSWLPRTLRASDTWTSFYTGGPNRNDNGIADRIVLQDQVQGAAAWNDVLVLDVPDCPDYSQGTTSVFTGVAPERVLDTRAATAVNYTGAKPGPGGSVVIPAGAFPNRPAGATAVAVTVTGTEASAPGFLQAFPTGGATPGASSNVNLPIAGGTVANLAVVPFGADGSITIFTSGGSHILADVSGYFVASPDPAAAGRLVTITQQRLLDTRPGAAINYTGPKPNASTVTVDLTASASGLPAGASAAVVNITATESGGPGFVQAAAAGELTPGESSVLNLTGADQTVAGLSIVPLDPDGSIDLFTSGSAHLVVDLIGWFTGDAASLSNSGKFVPLTPERIYDSRFETMVNVEWPFWRGDGMNTDRVYLAGMNDLPGAVFVNGTITANNAPGFVTFGGFDLSKPTSNINAGPIGGTVANAAIVATPGRSFEIDVEPKAGGTRGQVIVDLAGYFTR
jgi:hypothetical protein